MKRRTKESRRSRGKREDAGFDGILNPTSVSYGQRQRKPDLEVEI